MFKVDMILIPDLIKEIEFWSSWTAINQRNVLYGSKLDWIKPLFVSLVSQLNV